MCAVGLENPKGNDRIVLPQARRTPAIAKVGLLEELLKRTTKKFIDFVPLC